MRLSGLAVVLALGLSLAPLIVEAQPAGRVPRIGILSPTPISERVQFWEAFRRGLREHGYVEGQNITLVFPSGEVRRERLAHHAAELVSLKVDVIVTPNTDSVRARRRRPRFGDFAVDERGFQIGHKAVTIQWQDGTPLVVWPDEAATAKPRFPTPPGSGR